MVIIEKYDPDCRKWAFTFGTGMGLGKYHVIIEGTYEKARERMFELFGLHWCGQYPLEYWEAKGYTKPLNDFIEIGGL